jgi:hypothetical protein
LAYPAQSIRPGWTQLITVALRLNGSLFCRFATFI